jgi:hypothetical protein
MKTRESNALLLLTVLVTGLLIVVETSAAESSKPLKNHFDRRQEEPRPG